MEIYVQEIARLLEEFDERKQVIFYKTYLREKKERPVALMFAITMGFLGVDRFYVGDKTWGFVKLFSLGLFGIMWLIDMFLIVREVDDRNRELALQIIEIIQEKSKANLYKAEV